MDLAVNTGISVTVLSRYETRQRPVKVPAAQAIAAALGATLADLFDERREAA